jgi:ATP-dependent protease ClpP protease subunit
MIKFFHLLLACLTLLPIGTARAQEAGNYAPLSYHQEDPSTIYLNGEIDHLLLWKFANLLDVTPNATTIALSSPGGEVYSALVLAKTISRMGLNTVILRGDECNSACSFLYFAGMNRTAEGSVGVHQISSSSQDMNSGQVALADIIELMESFSVPNDVILKMLRTAPEDMHTYESADLEVLGLTGPRAVPSPSEVDAPLTQQVDTDNLPQLTDGVYAGGGINLEIDGEFADLTVSAPNCSGGINGFVRTMQQNVGIASAMCFISVRNAPGGGLKLLEGGPYCYGFHGFRCSFDGVIQRVD